MDVLFISFQTDIDMTTQGSGIPNFVYIQFQKRE